MEVRLAVILRKVECSRGAKDLALPVRPTS